MILKLGDGLFGRVDLALQRTLLRQPEGQRRVVLQHRLDDLGLAPVDQGFGDHLAHAAALVMETGGVLSHGAIVAREFGLPAVAGTAPLLNACHKSPCLKRRGFFVAAAPNGSPCRRPDHAHS